MNSLFNCLLDSLAQGILLVDKEYRVVIWNGWLERVTGLTKAEVIGEKVSSVCPCFAELKFRRILMDTLVHGQNCFFAGILHHAFVFPRDGGASQKAKRQNMQIESFFYQGEPFALIQITDITGQCRRVRCLQTLIKELESDIQTVKKAEASARHSALHDPLTGLCNRNLFYDHLEYAINQTKRDRHCFAAVLFIDLDSFKNVNDTYGHIIGDELLKKVAKRLKECLRQTDVVARFAGDEFVILLPKLRRFYAANFVGEKIRRSFDQAFEIEGISISITASIGISLYPVDAGDVEGMLKKADQAMYAVKTLGKNNYRLYNDRA
ncbi:MAG: diguanylate cyclase [Veillonellales bacterium]